MDTNAPRDYRLNGPENARAIERGLVGATWYQCPLSRKRLAELSQRRNGPAVRDTVIALLLIVGSGALAWHVRDSWWAVPAFFVYGTLYASIADSRWHEALHGTAFRTPWANAVMYHVSSFLILRQATPWRYSHLRHHREPLIIGRDPEIPLKPDARPKPLWLDVILLFASARELKRLTRHCFGRLDAEEPCYIPESRHAQVILEARIYMALLFALVAVCVWTGSILPALYLVLPASYGLWLVLTTGVVQHVGLPHDVLDLRMNSRTVYMNPVLRFLYWNINYHLDHHMFPTVPYHTLPALHDEIKHDCPPANPSLPHALREVFTILGRRRTEPGYVFMRPLPVGANPYLSGILACDVEETPIDPCRPRACGDTASSNV